MLRGLKLTGVCQCKTSGGIETHTPTPWSHAVSSVRNKKKFLYIKITKIDMVRLVYKLTHCRSSEPSTSGQRDPGEGKQKLAWTSFFESWFCTVNFVQLQPLPPDFYMR